MMLMGGETIAESETEMFIRGLNGRGQSNNLRHQK
jgi:hypothetical protein